MKKIDEAARQFALMYVDEGSKHFHPLRLAFRGGARHVLDAMTSEASVEAFAAAVEAMDDQDIDATPLEEIAAALCAVRKEIEGE